VVGAAVFAMTAFEEWRSFELRGEAATILQQYLSVRPIRQRAKSQRAGAR